jgi:hypothetical protein
VSGRCSAYCMCCITNSGCDLLGCKRSCLRNTAPSHCLCQLVSCWLQVMLNGSRSMHAVGDEGVSVTSAAGDEVLQIKTLDTALVSPGRPTPLPQGLHHLDMREGVHFNLVNQAWGTNCEYNCCQLDSHLCTHCFPTLGRCWVACCSKSC